MVVDISRSCRDSPCERVLKCQGDEGTLLPPLLSKTLKTSLQLGPPITSSGPSDDHARKTRNVLVAEAFLRFFLDLLHDHRTFFRDGENVDFEKEQFIKHQRSKHVQYFLEWFTETAMFNTFIHQRSSASSSAQTSPVLDALPYPDFYQLFDERLSRHAVSKAAPAQSGSKDVSKGNYKMILNKKVKIWRDKLRDLVN